MGGAETFSQKKKKKNDNEKNIHHIYFPCYWSYWEQLIGYVYVYILCFTLLFFYNVKSQFCGEIDFSLLPSPNI